MVSIMNEYIAKLHLQSDDITKGILNAALLNESGIASINIIVKSNKYIVDIKLQAFTVDNAIQIMNHFMERTRYHYSAYYIRFNEGKLLRYRYASCQENHEGFYCDVVIS